MSRVSLTPVSASLVVWQLASLQYYVHYYVLLHIRCYLWESALIKPAYMPIKFYNDTTTLIINMLLL